jgi:uncharacterized protein YdeI (YjbR/CyaY-like superfamily)
MREIEQAKLDGRWEAAYAPQSKATVPKTLQSALDRNPAAKRRFDRLDSRNRYAILHRVQDAKKPETRAQRIEKYLTMLGPGRPSTQRSRLPSPWKFAAYRTNSIA